MPKVCILRADHIGDLVLTTPLIRALGKSGWQVDVVAPSHGVLLENNPWLNDLFNLSEICPPWPRRWGKLAGWLRAKNYDAVILPFAFPRALLLVSLFSGAKIRVAMWGGLPARITGHTCRRSDYFSYPRPYAQVIQRCLEPLNVSPDGIEPELFLTPGESVEASRLITQNLLPDRLHIGIHPLAMGNACNLPLTAYHALARRILESTPWNLVVTGSSVDAARMEEWRDLARSAPGRVWISAGELTLRPLAAVIARLEVFVVPSTGPLHIAHALGIKTLSPFCPQTPVCPAIWGHAPRDASCLIPTVPPCDPRALHGQHCDFRGTISPDELFARLDQRVAERTASRSASTPASTEKSGGSCPDE